MFGPTSSQSSRDARTRRAAANVTFRSHFAPPHRRPSLWLPPRPRPLLRLLRVPRHSFDTPCPPFFRRSRCFSPPRAVLPFPLSPPLFPWWMHPPPPPCPFFPPTAFASVAGGLAVPLLLLRLLDSFVFVAFCSHLGDTSSGRDLLLPLRGTSPLRRPPPRQRVSPFLDVSFRSRGSPLRFFCPLFFVSRFVCPRLSFTPAAPRRNGALPRRAPRRMGEGEGGGGPRRFASSPLSSFRLSFPPFLAPPFSAPTAADRAPTRPFEPPRANHVASSGHPNRSPTPLPFSDASFFRSMTASPPLSFWRETARVGSVRPAPCNSSIEKIHGTRTRSKARTCAAKKRQKEGETRTFFRPHVAAPHWRGLCAVSHRVALFLSKQRSPFAPRLPDPSSSRHPHGSTPCRRVIVPTSLRLHLSPLPPPFLSFDVGIGVRVCALVWGHLKPCCIVCARVRALLRTS